MVAGASTSIVVWDARVARTAALGTLVTFGIALFLTAVTDEGGVAWNERLSRTLPAVPACAGFGAFVALQARRLRGELRALETLGRSPARAGLAAVVGAAVTGAILSVTVATRSQFDASAFFPELRTSSSIRFEDGTFIEDASGLRVAPDGSMRLESKPTEVATDATAAARRVRTRRLVTVVTAILTSLALALVGARGTPGRRDLAAVAVFAAVAVVVFHAIAADRLPIVAALLPTIALIAFAVIRYGGEEAWWTKD